MKRILALVILAVTLGSALGGCIVVPGGGYHDHYYHDHY
ncbi:hypothetical protein GGD41_007497 [Paraburkholderia bryophila]|uniref:Lipoprotein n=1 Tax=Paraburkholderia bryophila TaxID=420952 RepID=A0A7Z0B3W2_9BURK|nr:hypothetical protein [Paraburkholderia bryophila]NYH20704.1 hypothetical protein [Paraburkholderia bryophila]PQV46843.1 hypothetical protein B0G83_112224 [Paraburkholderia sp. BL21I4N1]